MKQLEPTPNSPLETIAWIVVAGLAVAGLLVAIARAAYGLGSFL